MSTAVIMSFTGEWRKCIGTKKHKCNKTFPVKKGAKQDRCTTCNVRAGIESTRRSKLARGIKVPKDRPVHKPWNSLEPKWVNQHFYYIDQEEEPEMETYGKYSQGKTSKREVA
jgi:hypothetical protein